MTPPVGASTCVLDRVFPREAVELLNQVFDAQAAQAETGSIVHADASHHVARHVRRSRIVWAPYSAQTHPVYELIAAIVRRANEQVFKFDLRGLDEPLQLAAYSADDEGFYGWHVDIGAGRLSERKISLVAPLSDPSSYEGGGFEVFYDDQPTPIEMPLGRVVLFPSYLLHRVRPVTRGVRRSLAVWVSGPPFR